MGGIIRRVEGSEEPNGVIEEAAWFTALPTLLGNVGPTGMKALTEVLGRDPDQLRGEWEKYVKALERKS